MSEPQITVKPYYHTGIMNTPGIGDCSITVSRLSDSSNPVDRFFGSVNSRGEEVHSVQHTDGNVAALLCHSWVTIHGMHTDCTCYPPDFINTLSSTDC